MARSIAADFAPGTLGRIGAGFAGSLAVALSSWSSAAVLEPFIASLIPGFELTSRTGGSPLAATVTMLGLAGMIWAWWSLRGRLTPTQWAWVMAIWTLPLLFAAPLQSRDMYSYAAQGQLLNEGLNPYTHGVRDMQSDWVRYTSAVWLVSPSPYGPFWLMLARGVAVISGGNIMVAILALRLISLAALAATAWATFRISQRLGHTEQRTASIMWLALANPFTLTQVVAGGHNDALVTALVLVAVVRAWDQRLGEASTLVALAAMIKVTAVVALPFVALLWLVVARPVTFRNLVATLARALGFAAIPAALLSLGLGVGFAWVVPVGGLEEGVSPSLVSALGILLGTGASAFAGPGAIDTTVALTQTLGLLAMAAFLVVSFVVVAGRILADDAAYFQRRLAPVGATQVLLVLQGLAMALTITAALAPTIRVWYILWFVPVAALVNSSRGLETGIAALTSAATLAVFPDGNSVGVPAPNLLLSVLAVALLVWLYRSWRAWAAQTSPGLPAIRSAVFAESPAPQPVPAPAAARD